VNLIYYVLGVGVIFIAKLLVNNKNDEPIEKWKRIFEIPADLTMLAFMMGLAGTASLAAYTRESQAITILIVGLSVVSIAIYKENCTKVTSRGGVTQFISVRGAIGLFMLNVALSLIAVILSYSFLGANES